MSKKVQNSSGSLTYDDKVIKKIVTLTLGEMTDFLVLDQRLAKKIMPVTIVDTARFLEVKINNKVVNVSADIIVQYGCDMSTLHESALARVKEEIERMTRFTIGKMNLNVRDILPVADFQTLYRRGMRTGSIDNKTSMTEDSFSMRINHFVRNIKERAVGMGDRLEGAGKGAKTKIKLFSKKGEGKTREFVTNLATKKTNFERTDGGHTKASAGMEQDEAIDFSAIDARNINDLEFSEAALESQQMSQVSEDVFHKLDPEKATPEKE